MKRSRNQWSTLGMLQRDEFFILILIRTQNLIFLLLANWIRKLDWYQFDHIPSDLCFSVQGMVSHGLKYIK